MNCKEVEDILVEGGEITADVRRHLEECASCRSLSKLMSGLMAPKPSEALDKAVLTQVKTEMRMRARRRPAWLHWAYAAAAAAVLVLSLWIGRQAFWNETAAPNDGVVVAEADSQAAPELDPLFDMWVEAEDGVADVEFTLKYSDLVADGGDADVETKDERIFSLEEFQQMADDMFSLELMMYQETLN